MYQKIINSRKEELGKAVEFFRQELAKIRTGRATPGLVENLMVDYYGTKTPLKQAANISVPEPRLILIQPWDIDGLANIEAAIKMSDLGLNPNNDGKVIRINLPPLTEERRKELVKFLNQKAEETRVTIRNIREDIWKNIQKAEDRGEISEDDKYIAKERLQELINDYNQAIEELREVKEKEIMTI